MKNWFNTLKAPVSAGCPEGDSSGGLAIMAVGWLSAVVALMAVLVKYSNAPGPSGTPPFDWPEQSGLSRQPRQATLVMFAHPRCPCTRASLGELELLVAHCRERFHVHVVFIRPAGMGEDWVKTDLWRSAAAIPGATIHRDDDAVEARRFHAETSGQTLLYDTTGHLVFQGGITASRGHSGDNPGRSAIESLTETESTGRVQKSTGRVQTPVFGCSLFETGCREGRTTECTP